MEPPGLGCVRRNKRLLQLLGKGRRREEGRQDTRSKVEAGLWENVVTVVTCLTTA